MSEIIWTWEDGWLDEPIPARMVIVGNGRWEMVPEPEFRRLVADHPNHTSKTRSRT